MDYSLLVGIYDGTIPPDLDDEDDEGEGEEGNGYLSSDDLGEGPHSPHSPTPGEYGIIVCLAVECQWCI